MYPPLKWNLQIKIQTRSIHRHLCILYKKKYKWFLFICFCFLSFGSFLLTHCRVITLCFSFFKALINCHPKIVFIDIGSVRMGAKERWCLAQPLSMVFISAQFLSFSHLLSILLVHLLFFGISFSNVNLILYLCHHEWERVLFVIKLIASGW